MKKKGKFDMTISQKMAELGVDRKKKRKSIPRIFQDVKEEMKKVSWTTKEELVACTRIVIGAIFALGLGIYVVDLSINFIFQGIGNFIRFAT